VGRPVQLFDVVPLPSAVSFLLLDDDKRALSSALIPLWWDVEHYEFVRPKILTDSQSARNRRSEISGASSHSSKAQGFPKGGCGMLDMVLVMKFDLMTGVGDLTRALFDTGIL